MRTLFEIIEAVKNNETVTEDEMRYSICAMDALMTFDRESFMTLVKGEFYSIYRKGDIIQIIKEKEDKNNKEFDEIRIIPSKSAQGFQVELFKDNSIICRTHMDVNHLIGYCLNNKINERLG